jgi:hypothetical protein
MHTTATSKLQCSLRYWRAHVIVPNVEGAKRANVDPPFTPQPSILNHHTVTEKIARGFYNVAIHNLRTDRCAGGP